MSTIQTKWRDSSKTLIQSGESRLAKAGVNREQVLAITEIVTAHMYNALADVLDVQSSSGRQTALTNLLAKIGARNAAVRAAAASGDWDAFTEASLQTIKEDQDEPTP